MLLKKLLIKTGLLMAIVIATLFIFSLGGCASSYRYHDPTHPESAKKHKKYQQKDLERFKAY